MLLYFKSKNISFKILTFYLLYCLVSDIFLSKLSIKLFNSEIYSYRLFTLIEFFSLEFLLYFSIQNIKFKRIIWVFNIIFIVLLVIELMSNSFKEFDSIPTGVECILILATSILLIYERLLNPKIDKLFDATVIIAFGLIIFFAGTFFIFILSQKNFNDNSFLTSYGFIVAFFNIIKNIFITIAISNKSTLDFTKNKKFQNI